MRTITPSPHLQLSFPHSSRASVVISYTLSCSPSLENTQLQNQSITRKQNAKQILPLLAWLHIQIPGLGIGAAAKIHSGKNLQLVGKGFSMYNTMGMIKSQVFTCFGKIVYLSSNIWYKLHQIPKLKCYSSCLCSIHWSQVCNREWRWTGDAPTTSEWSTILLRAKVHLILEV